MTDTLKSEQLATQAAALRRAGKSRREIKLILGVGHTVLDRALRDVPPPAWTRRPRAKDDLHAKARDLRARGYTYNEIAAELGVSKGSISLWVRDMPRVGRISYEEIRKRNAEGVSSYWQAEGLRREARRQAVSEAAADEIGTLTDREILIAGAIAYWCEGCKSKPHRPSEEIAFINSDPQLIRFFMTFLAAAGVSRERLICRLMIHESADAAAAQKFWQHITQLPVEQFRRPTLKRHNPTTVRKNTGENYHGCLVIRVRQSAELYRLIEGWAAAAMAARAAGLAIDSDGRPGQQHPDTG
jgi:transposase